jgi:hypothetical protein
VIDHDDYVCFGYGSPESDAAKWFAGAANIGASVGIVSGASFEYGDLWLANLLKPWRSLWVEIQVQTEA